MVMAGRTSFRIITVAVPLLGILAVLGLAIYQEVIERQAPEDTTIGIIDLTVAPPDPAQGQTESHPIFGSFLRDSLTPTTFSPYADQSVAIEALLAEEIDELYIIPEDYLTSGRVVQVKKETSGISIEDTAVSSGPLKRFVLNNLLVGVIGPERAERVITPFILDSVEVDEQGVPVEPDAEGRNLLFYGLVAVLLFISVFSSAGYLLQGLSEEKENRIMEVLLSSLRPDQLMLGKLLGLGSAGLFQMAVWLTSGALFVVAMRQVVDVPRLGLPPAGGFIVALIYFVAGYFFFGALMAALGAVTSSWKEANQTTFIIILPAIAPIYLAAFILEHPDGFAARALSFFPWTAVTVSFMRLGVDAMGPLDIAVSITVLCLGVALATMMTLRLFRTYLLMYGQRPGIRQVLRTLRGA